MPDRLARAGKRMRRSPEERLHAIMPSLQWDAAVALGKTPVALNPSGCVIETLDDFVILCSRRQGTSDRSLWRWREKFLNGGGNLEALRDRPRCDRGTSHAFRGRARAVAVICGLHARGLTSRAIYNTLAEVWPDLYPGTRVPSCATVRAFIQSLFSGPELLR